MTNKLLYNRNILSNLDGVVNIYWSQLVLRPLCVDRLEITIGEQQPLVFLDPADEQVLEVILEEVI